MVQNTEHRTTSIGAKVTSTSYRTNSGFTLVELSIVIVIIGLIVAGVTAGQSLVRQAQLRSVISDINKIKVAVNTYRLEYDALPGDHSSATDYWGTAGGCYSDTSGGTTTCNGDGSKKLSYVHFTDTSGVRHEPWHFWKHLVNSKLWAGDFSGYSDDSKCGGTGNYCMQPGINSPEGPFSGSGWFAFSIKTYSNGIVWQGKSKNKNRNIIALGTPSSEPENRWYGESLTTSQQYSIDNKLDDGMPYTGKINDMSGNTVEFTPGCAIADSSEFSGSGPYTTLDATYDFSSTGLKCILLVDME